MFEALWNENEHGDPHFFFFLPTKQHLKFTISMDKWLKLHVQNLTKVVLIALMNEFIMNQKQLS